VTGLMCAAFAKTTLSAPKVTGVSPNVGPAGRAKTVTVHGHGGGPLPVPLHLIAGLTKKSRSRTPLSSPLACGSGVLGRG
jgi:hypothetical protein